MEGFAKKMVPILVIMLMIGVAAVLLASSYVSPMEKQDAKDYAKDIDNGDGISALMEEQKQAGGNADALPAGALVPQIMKDDAPAGASFKDTDGDGLGDQYEIEMGLDPLDWDSDNDLMSDGAELLSARGSTDPRLKDTDNDGLEDPWEDNDGDGLINYEEQEITGTDPNSADSDDDTIPDDLELQIVAPGPINSNSWKYHKYTQIYVASDNDGADAVNASGPDGRPGIAWTDDDGDGEAASPTNFYDADGDGVFTLYKLNSRGEFVWEYSGAPLNEWKRVLVDIPTFDVTDLDPADGIPLVKGTAKLADGLDNDFSGTADEGIDEKDEIAYSPDGAPGWKGIDDDGDTKDSDGDGYCDGQERFANSDPLSAADIPMHMDANGDWVPDPVQPSADWIDEGDEYGFPGTDDASDDSGDDDGQVDSPDYVYDRYNPTLDISIIDGVIDSATGGAFRWLVPYLWRSNEFYAAGKGGLPLNSTCIALCHMNPALLDQYGTNVYGSTLWDRGGPYRWNNYDLNPTEKDTDGDGMDDEWDTRPAFAEDRLDTHVAINYFKDTGNSVVYEPKFGAGGQRVIGFETGAALDPGVHDGYGFPHLIEHIPLEKGQKYEMSLYVGLENSPPDSLPIRRGYYRPLNITVGWHNMSYGEDQRHYTADDDFDGDGEPLVSEVTRTGTWTYDPDNADMPVITLGKMDVKADKVPADLGLEYLDLSAEGYLPGGNYLGHSGLNVPYKNHTWADGSFWSRMTFYELKLFFYIPEGCPAGILFIDVSADAEGNVFYENTFDEFADYPMFYN